MQQEQKTIFKLFSISLSKFLPSQGQHANVVLIWGLYFVQIAIILNCLIISLDFQFSRKQLDVALLDQIFMYLRIGFSLIFIITKIKLFLLVQNIFGILILWYYRNHSIMITAWFASLLAHIVYYFCKQQRNYNFDSKLSLAPSIIKTFLIHSIQLLTLIVQKIDVYQNLRAQQSIISRSLQKNIVNICIVTLFIFFTVKIQYYYRLNTKNLLQNLHFGVFAQSCSVLFLFLLNNSNTYIYFVVIGIIFVLSVIWGLYTPIQFDIKALFCLKYQSLAVIDKIQYVKSLIYLIQHQPMLKIKTFLNFHYTNCDEPRCPVKYFLQANKPEKQYKQCLQLLLKQVLEKSYSQFSFLFEIFLFYRAKYDDIYIKLIKNDTFCHIRQRSRIIIQNQKKDDLDLEIFNIQQQEEALTDLVKLFIEKYINFLNYLQQRRISLPICEKKSTKLLDLRQKIIQYSVNNHKLTENSRKLLNILREKVFNFKNQEQTVQKLPSYVIIKNQETAMVIVSSQIDSLGRILDSNAAARSLLGYRQQQLKALYVNELIPESFREQHTKILQIGSKRIQYDKTQKTISKLIFVACSNGYSTIIKFLSHPLNGIKGKRWSVELIPYKRDKSMIVIDDDGNIIAINQNSISMGFSLQMIGYQLQYELIERIKIQETIIIQPGQSIMVDLRMQQNLKLQLLQQQQEIQKQNNKPFKNIRPQYNLPHYSIIVITKQRENNGLKNLDPFALSIIRSGRSINTLALNLDQSKSNTNNNYKLSTINSELCIGSKLFLPGANKIIYMQNQKTNFKFFFDENKLKYSCQSQNQNTQKFPGFVQRQNQNDPWNIFKNFANHNSDFSQDIYQMIYLGGKLEFKENRVVQLQDYTWSSLINIEQQESKQQVLKDIQLNNFSQNMKQILMQKPPTLNMIAFILFIAGLIILTATIGVMILQIKRVDIQSTKSKSLRLFLERQYFFVKTGNNALRSYFISQNIWNIKEIINFQNFTQFYRLEGQLTNTFSQYQQIYNQRLSFSIQNFNHLAQIQKDIQIKSSLTYIKSSQTISNMAYLIINGIIPGIQQIKDKSLVRLNSYIQNLWMAQVIFISAVCFIGLIVAIGFFCYSKTVLAQRDRLLFILSTFQDQKIQLLKFQIEDIQQNLQLYLGEDERDEKYIENQQMKIYNNKLLVNKLKKKIINDQPNPFFCLFIIIILGLGLSVFYLFDAKARAQFPLKFQPFYSIFNPGISTLDKIWLKSSYLYKESILGIDRILIRSKITEFLNFFDNLSSQLYMSRINLEQDSQLAQYIFKIYTNKICQLESLKQNFCKTKQDFYIAKSINQVAIQQSFLLQELFKQSQNFNLTIIERLSQLSKILNSQLIKQGTQKSSKQIQKQFKYSKEWIIIIGLIYISIQVLILIIGLCSINKKQEFIQQPLNVLVNLIPMQLLLKNNQFKKWYYQKFKDSVY